MTENLCTSYLAIRKRTPSSVVHGRLRVELALTLSTGTPLPITTNPSTFDLPVTNVTLISMHTTFNPRSDRPSGDQTTLKIKTGWNLHPSEALQHRTRRSHRGWYGSWRREQRVCGCVIVHVPAVSLPNQRHAIAW